MAGGLTAYIGVHPTSPFAGNGSAIGTGTTATTPAVNTTATTVEVVHLLSKVQEALPAPAGTTTIIAGTAGVAPDSLGAVAADETFAGAGNTPARSATSASALSSEWIAQTLVLQRAPGIPTANLSWTASPSSWADGYSLTRSVGGTVQATQQVTGVATTSAVNRPLTAGTTYTFRLMTTRGTWRSGPVTATPFTPVAC